MGADTHLPHCVAVNGQFPPGGFVGGVEQFVHSLLGALGALEDGDERYVVVTMPGFEHHPSFRVGARIRTVPGFLRPGRRFRVVELLPPGLFRAIKKLGLSLFPSSLQTLGAGGPVVPDGSFFDGLGAGVVHFPFQSFFRTTAPTIFQPHDLQHLHFPRFFTTEELTTRERVYPEACAAASAVVVEARWVKKDICQTFGIADEKVLFIPIGAPGGAAALASDASPSRSRHTGRFVFYPAQAWPHKNHLALLEALRLLHDRDGIALDLVCTGRKTSFWPTIAERVARLGLRGRVRFVGYVEAGELAALYRDALAVVLPSLCEGAGQPLLEAFEHGAPVACSGTTSLAEYAGDAALLFDPEKPAEIADALRRLVQEPALGEQLCSAGHARSVAFSWERSARTYRALYRELAKWPMTSEDHSLLREARS
ncbi:MAG: glycosyltransferase family 4 protein [Thermoanaerobaculaceae bacterium]|nr:glycosyltransferase family 4 protein [Thermoanaerobaculaceae bacterium]